MANIKRALRSGSETLFKNGLKNNNNNKDESIKFCIAVARTMTIVLD